MKIVKKIFNKVEQLKERLKDLEVKLFELGMTGLAERYQAARTAIASTRIDKAINQSAHMMAAATSMAQQRNPREGLELVRTAAQIAHRMLRAGGMSQEHASHLAVDMLKTSLSALPGVAAVQVHEIDENHRPGSPGFIPGDMTGGGHEPIN